MIAQIGALRQLQVDGPRAELWRKLIRILDTLVRAAQVLRDRIRSAQGSAGWPPEAKELVSAIALAARNGLKEAAAAIKDLASDGLMARLPSDAKLMLGLSQHPDWFTLSVGMLVRAPLHFIWVGNGGMAQRLGFRSDDLVLEFAGSKPNGLLALKTLIKANLGREVEALVRRDGKRVRLRVRVPKQLDTE
jgi:hypothetical protein